MHPRFDDLSSSAICARAHVTVLPHRWGTHSGWLELARDLGTRVVAPDCGYYGDQWSEVVSYVNNETLGLDAASLAAAVARAIDLPSSTRPTGSARRRSARGSGAPTTDLPTGRPAGASPSPARR